MSKVQRTLVLLRAGTDSSWLVESEEDASHHKDWLLEDHRVQAQVRSVASPVLAMAQWHCVVILCPCTSLQPDVEVKKT